MTAILERMLQRAGLLYAILPVVLLAVFIWHNGLLTPAYDEFYIVQPLIIDARDGSLSWTALLQAYNGQRIPLPLLVTLGLALLTQWDVRADLLLNCGLAVGAVGLVIAMWRKQRLPVFGGVMWVALACLLLSPVQFINFTFGFQKCIWFLLLGVYGSAYALARWPGRPLAWWIGGMSAFGASWSFLSGHILWIIIPFGQWLAGERRWRPYGVWILFAALNIGLYLVGYRVSDTPVDTPVSLFAYGRILTFPLAFLGGPFSAEINPLAPVEAQNPTTALIVGAVGIALLIGTILGSIWQETFDWRRAAPWLLLTAFSLGSAGLIVVGRALDITNTVTSRYTTLALPFWIGLLGLVAQGLLTPSRHQRRRRALIVLYTLAVPIVVGTFTLTYYRFLSVSVPRDRLIQCVLTLDDPACPSILLGNDAAATLGTDLIIDRVAELRAEHLSVFAQSVVTDLATAALLPVSTGDTPPSWEVYTISGTVQSVLLMPTPNILDQRLYIPTAFAQVEFVSAVFVPHPQFIPGDAERLLADGADFSLTIIDEAGAAHRAVRATFDPLKHTIPMPVVVDLTPYRGQIVTLRYSVAPRSNPDYDWAMWVDPQLVVE